MTAGTVAFHIRSKIRTSAGFTLLLLILLAASACSAAVGEPAQETETPLPSKTPGVTATEPPIDAGPELTATPTVTATPPPSLPDDISATLLQAQLDLPAGTVIALHKTGGFAGVDELTIYYEDGRIDTPDGKQASVPPEAVTAHLAALDVAGFFEMTQPKSEPICCDHFTYTLYARDGDRENVITVSGGDPDLAPELLEVILAL